MTDTAPIPDLLSEYWPATGTQSEFHTALRVQGRLTQRIAEDTAKVLSGHRLIQSGSIYERCSCSREADVDDHTWHEKHLAEMLTGVTLDA